MPWFQFLTKSVGPTDKFEDDAKDASELHGRAIAAKLSNNTFTTNVVVVPEAEDIAAAMKAGEPTPLPETVVTGSWDPDDVLHVIPFDEAGQVELEGDEADEDEDEKPNVSALSGKRR